MAFQTTDIGKPQLSKRKSRNFAYVSAFTLLFTTILLYFSYVRYSLNKLSQSSSTFDHQQVQDFIRPIAEASLQPLSSQENIPKQDQVAIKILSPISNNINKPLLISKEPEVTSTTKASSFKNTKRPTKKKKKKKRLRRSDNYMYGDSKSREMLSQVIDSENCNIFSGEWVKNREAPYYTNSTCSYIQQHQDCMNFGRPDTDFLKWKWKPDDDQCELSLFDPNNFLELVRGKSLAFVGDSVARNHMQSLICLLSKVVNPVDVSIKNDQNKQYSYPDYNFNISIFWAPFLVKVGKTDFDDANQLFKLYLDEFDEDWTNKIQGYDYVIISAGHWFFRPTKFYINQKFVSCLYCSDANVYHHNTLYFSYRRAFRTALKAINNMTNFKGITFVRTFAPSHFEGGGWDSGGDCVRTRPFKRNETVLDDYNLEMYKIQLEELKIAQNVGAKKGLKFRLFDATQSMLLRPDGHPSKYGHWPVKDRNIPNDCVHWCLPGPIDTWNDFLQELLRRELER